MYSTENMYRSNGAIQVRRLPKKGVGVGAIIHSGSQRQPVVQISDIKLLAGGSIR